MASENKFSTPPLVSAVANPKIETNIPPFPDATEDDFSEFDNTDWQDFLSYHAGVR